MTEIDVRAMDEFDLPMERFHNYSTSVALSGLYRRIGKKIRIKKTVNLMFGSSKDQRKDLKQLIWVSL